MRMSAKRQKGAVSCAVSLQEPRCGSGPPSEDLNPGRISFGEKMKLLTPLPGACFRPKELFQDGGEPGCLSEVCPLWGQLTADFSAARSVSVVPVCDHFGGGWGSRALLARACPAGLRLHFGSGLCCLWVRSWSSTVQLISLGSLRAGVCKRSVSLELDSDRASPWCWDSPPLGSVLTTALWDRPPASP